MKYIILVLLYSFLSSVNTIRADGWEITQYTQVNDNDIELKQSGVTRASSQALNYIASNEIVRNAKQYVSLNEKKLTLLQEDGVRNSHQAVNLTVAQAAETLQKLSNVGHISLQQGNGNNNIQAINSVISSKPLSTLDQQVFAPSSSLSFHQNEGSSNKQAANYLETSVINEAMQSLVADSIYFHQAGIDNLQAANVIIIEDGVGLLEQNLSAENVTVDFSSANDQGSIKATNYIKYN